MATRPRAETPAGPTGKRRGPNLIVGVVVLALLATVVVLFRSLSNKPSAPAGPGPAVLALGGPTRIVADVPVGYPHTRDGALAAGMNYSQAVADSIMAPDVVRNSRLEAFVADGTLPEQKDIVTKAGQLGRPALGEPAVFLRRPIVGEIRSYDGTNAAVTVWTVEVTSGPKLDYARGTWGFDDLQLAWEHDDWKLVARTGRDAPAPAADPDAVAATPAQVAALLSNGVRYYDAPIPR
jgi:hypothetical protein